jgi:HK97 family phage major capsid protein/HK97 family phage prohead protease
MALERAYAVLDVKSIDEDARIITGIASTPSTDRMGDIVEPSGAKFTLPLPLLWQHDSRQPIGNVIEAKVTSAGIFIKAQIAAISDTGALKDRLDTAWQSIKAKLVRGLSIGFRATEDPEPIKGTYGLRFVGWEWLELSAVTIPANADASIQTIKSCDTGLAATGTDGRIRTVKAHTPGGSGTARAKARTGTDMKKTISQQISEFEATRQAKSARMDEIMDTAAEAGTTLDAEQKEEYDGLDEDVKNIDEHLVRLRAAEKRQKDLATEVKGTTEKAGSDSRGGSIVRVSRPDLPKGFLFARYAICMANSRGIPGEAIRLAKEHYPDDPGVLKLVEKTAVAGGATSGSHYLDDMVPYNIMNDFIEYLRPGSIIGKFGGPNPGAPGRNYPNLRRVGFNERVSGMSTGYTAGWKGEGLPALPSAAVTFNTSLTWNCMAALAVLTKEAIRFSNPNAETQVRDDLARAVNGKLDLDFVDPAKAASGTTSPASITNGIVATGVSGTAATNVRHDIATMLALFATNKLSATNLVLIMSATMAAQISMMVNALGQPEFPALTLEGGYLQGIPVIVSEHLTAVGSPSTQSIILAKADEIYLADDGVVTVEASDQASIEMVDTSSQSGLSGTGASLVSLWQSGLVGLMANREITWKLRRSTAVQYISPAAYAVPTS